MMRKGKVFLAGAGPGAADLLTLRAARALAEAEVVLYDALAPAAALRFAPPSAECVCVGKRGGRGGWKQDEINEKMAELAEAGKTVVRLKGGDPFVFGRGGEEAEFLSRRGIPFEVIPGLTAGLTAPAAAGIPVTDRRLASSVALATGREDDEKQESSVDWAALAAAVDTIVVYMGRGNLPAIVERVLRGGRSPETPAALIERGATAAQRVLLTSLGRLEADAAGYSAPCVIVIGEAVRLRDSLSTLHVPPLFGKRIVVTRAREKGLELADELECLGAEVFVLPTIQTRPIAPNPALAAAFEALGRPETRPDWIVFTSASGVNCFFDALLESGRDCRLLAGVRLACIGPSTAEALKSRGILADLMPQRYVSASLAEALITQGAAGRRFLLARAAEAGDELPRSLAEAGAIVQEVAVYETTRPDRLPPATERLIEDEPPDYIVLASPSAARNFLEMLGQDAEKMLRKARVVSIGPVTTRECRRLGMKDIVEAETSTAEGIVEAILRTSRPGTSGNL